eukprot:TRINITY_DN1067_c0_g1_i4.p1 TRINITY_DN1067_c0_g1~~TRINITY_DN1067_c0_g1_i4.p1  ORF type:complete len:686 (-),score=137.85 TRINITY_DN1067_c0_g1_i4:52-2109(-)
MLSSAPWAIPAVLLVLVSLTVGHRCIHDQLVATSGSRLRAPNQVPQNYPADDFPRGDNTQPLRILYDTRYLSGDPATCYNEGETVQAYNGGGNVPHTCTKADILSDSNRDYLNKLLQDSANKFSSLLQVVRVQEPSALTLSSSSQCGYGNGVQIPIDYVSPGVADYDFVAFVTTRPIIGGDILAFGGPCLFDQYGRPIAGQLNINPPSIKVAAADYWMELGTVMHETSHALGFTSFTNFRSPTGFYQPVGNTTNYSYANNAPRPASIITSPTVLEWVRTYFACDTLAGAELEDMGGPGTAGSHWKKRVFANEYMTGTSEENPIASGLTLALFQDSGWYWANFPNADLLTWGNGMGCDFATRSCQNWPTNNGYFCNTDNTETCMPDLYAKGLCSTVPNPVVPIPSPFQYFSDPSKGGASSLSDYCPIALPYQDGWCTNTSLQSGNKVFNTGEKYTDTSRCFMSTLLKGAVQPSKKMTCYETKCASASLIKVRPDDGSGLWYDCTTGGRNIDYVPLFGGTITCPARASDICAGAQTDTTWPTFLSVSPNSALPGAMITITGENFVNGSRVIVDADCSEVTVVSSTTITARLPPYGSISNPNNLLFKKVNVAVVSPNGYSSVGGHAFDYQIKLDKDFIIGAGEWLKTHWYVALAGAVVLVALILLIVYCCCCKNRKKDDGHAKGGRHA